MVEYRHNKNWDILYLRDTYPSTIKESMEQQSDKLGKDLEVIDIKINSFKPYSNATFQKFDITVIYRIIDTEETNTTIKGL